MFIQRSITHVHMKEILEIEVTECCSPSSPRGQKTNKTINHCANQNIANL